VSFTLPGSTQFRSIGDPAWETFLTDPFAAGPPTLNLDAALRANLQDRFGPGALTNHARHADAAHRALEQAIQDDMNARGLTRQDFQFFAAFTREIADPYGRLLAWLNVSDPSATRPPDYNTRMLEKGLASTAPSVDRVRPAGRRR